MYSECDLLDVIDLIDELARENYPNEAFKRAVSLQAGIFVQLIEEGDGKIIADCESSIILQLLLEITLAFNLYLDKYDLDEYRNRMVQILEHADEFKKSILKMENITYAYS